MCVSTGLSGVFSSLERGVLKTFPGRSTRGLTSLISGVLKWSEVGRGENTPLSKSETKPVLGEVDTNDDEFGAASMEEDITAEGLVVLGVELGRGAGWVRGCTGAPSLCGDTKLYNGEKVMASSPDKALVASLIGVRKEEPRILERL